MILKKLTQGRWLFATKTWNISSYGATPFRAIKGYLWAVWNCKITKKISGVKL